MTFKETLREYPWGIGISAAGTAYVVMHLWKGAKTMEGQHWVMLLVMLVVGYALGRLWATPAKVVGLP
jgi:hypothetical protein